MTTINSCHRSIDPHCILCGYTFYQYNYGSAVYFMAAIYCKSLSPKHRYVYLAFETCHNICWMFVFSFYQVLRVHTLALNICKVFRPSFSLLTSHFRGNFVTHEICTPRYLSLSVVKCRISVSYTLTPWNNLCHNP
jgi:hypothetical protein